MNVNERVTAEIDGLRRRGLAAAPVRHPLRTPECPPLGALAGGRLSPAEARHAAGCKHCRAVGRAAQAPEMLAPAMGALAAALLLGVLFSGGRTPARYPAPAPSVTAPAPRALPADWPAPLRLRAPGVRLPLPAPVPSLPTIRPLERFQPPSRVTVPMPLAALAAPGPPMLEPAPPLDVVGILGLRVL